MPRKKKSALQKKRDNGNSSYWNKRATSMWGEVVHALWEDECIMRHKMDCKGNPEAHHLVSRRIRSARHDPTNGVILCSKHHKFCPMCSPHMGPLGFAAEMRERFGMLLEGTRKHNTRPLIQPSFKECYETLEAVLNGIQEIGAEPMRRRLGIE